MLCMNLKNINKREVLAHIKLLTNSAARKKRIKQLNALILLKFDLKNLKKQLSK